MFVPTAGCFSKDVRDAGVEALWGAVCLSCEMRGEAVPLPVAVEEGRAAGAFRSVADGDFAGALRKLRTEPPEPPPRLASAALAHSSATIRITESIPIYRCITVPPENVFTPPRPYAAICALSARTRLCPMSFGPPLCL